MLWLKALHVIFVVTWFAGLFYLPRLYIYHVESTQQAVRDQLMRRIRQRFGTVATGSAAAGCANTPPPADTSQYPRPWGVGAIPTIGAFSVVLETSSHVGAHGAEDLAVEHQRPIGIGIGSVVT